MFELVRPVSRARRRLSICRVSCKTCLAFFRHDGLHRPNRAKGARVARDKLLAWSLRASVTTRSTELTGRSENMPSDGSTSFLLLVAAGHSCDLRREHVGNVMQFSKMQSWSLQDSSWTVRCLQASRCSPPAMAGPGTWKPPSTRTFSHAGHHGRCTLVNLEGPNKQGKFNTAGRIRSQ